MHGILSNPSFNIWWNYYQNCLEFEDMKMSCSKQFNFGFSILRFGVNNNICMEHKNWMFKLYEIPLDFLKIFNVWIFVMIMLLKLQWKHGVDIVQLFISSMVSNQLNYVWYGFKSTQLCLVRFQFNSIRNGHVWLSLKLRVEKNWCENEELLDDYDYYGQIWT
jgi:hypothetical protein